MCWLNETTKQVFPAAAGVAVVITKVKYIYLNVFGFFFKHVKNIVMIKEI